MASGSQSPSISRDDRILITYVGPDLMWAEWISEQLQRRAPWWRSLSGSERTGRRSGRHAAQRGRTLPQVRRGE